MNKETKEKENLRIWDDAINHRGILYFYRSPKSKRGENDFIRWEFDCTGEEFVIRVNDVGQTSFSWPDKTQTQLIMATARALCMELVWTYAEKLRNNVSRIHSVANAWTIPVT